MENNVLVNLLRNGILVSFQIGCLSLAIFMGLLQFKNYQSNQDSSSVSYKTFMNKNEVVYPTFSICLHGENGEIFRSSKGQLSCSYPCTTNETFRNENTEKCELECNSNDEYFKVISGSKEDNVSFGHYEEMVVDIESIVLEFYSVTTSGKKIQKIDPQSRQNFKNVFSITYQDPWKVCFTKKETPEQKNLLSYDYLELEDGKSLSNQSHYDYYILVHQKGQLLRRLRTPNEALLKKDKHKQGRGGKKAAKKNKKGKIDKEGEEFYGYSLYVDIRVNSVEVLNKRPDAVNPCNKSLYDEDTRWISNALEELDCIPSFFKRFNLVDTTFDKKVCNVDQYSQYKNGYNPEHYFAKVASTYDRPCVVMNNVVTATQRKVSNVEDLPLNITSDDKNLEKGPDEDPSERNKEDNDANEVTEVVEIGDDSKNNKKPPSGLKKNKKNKNGDTDIEPTPNNNALGEDTEQVPCKDEDHLDPKCNLKVKVKIEYIAEGYKETVNYRAFDILSLCSQIGGIIGMFLGYSLLHVPTFFGRGITWIENMFRSQRYKKDNSTGNLGDTGFLKNWNLKVGLNSNVDKVSKILLTFVCFKL